jgi:hypothetical protein
VLLAYPSTDRDGYATLTSDPKLAAAVTVMVDDIGQLDLIESVRAGHRRGPGLPGAGHLAADAGRPDTRRRLGAHRCAPPSSWPLWRGRSSAAPASGWSG